MARYPQNAFALQYEPSLAVNNNDIVGVTWFDTRNHPLVSGYDVYFSASLDRGETFCEPIRVTDVSSKPRLDHRWHPTEKARYRWLPGFDDRRWANGGDYVGMAAAADGSFHPVWPDARHDGVQQLYTARIIVNYP